MEIAKTIDAVRNLVRAARDKEKTIGLVPTMGALHQGHISLIEAAAGQSQFVVVSIFVNPTQFEPGADFENYPRNLDADIEICQKAGVNVIFAPSAEEIYPRQNLTWVNVEQLTEPLCGRFRPGHFRGVTTVCAKLFNIVQPDIAFFGRKDAQQAIVIKRMVEDLNIPLEIVVCPTVRQTSGLAVSSRNKYLNENQKKDAALLYAALQSCREMIDRGTRDSRQLIDRMRKVLSRCDAISIEYISIVDAQSLKELETLQGQVLVALAVRLGPARLIDNILVDVSK